MRPKTLEYDYKMYHIYNTTKKREREKERESRDAKSAVDLICIYVLPSRKIQIIKIFNMHKAFRSIKNVFIDTIILILAVCVCVRWSHLVSFCSLSFRVIRGINISDGGRLT